MKKGKVLITGGAGFIGSHTADALRAKGYRVRIVDALLPPVHNGRPARSASGSDAGGWPSYSLGKGYELIRADVRKKETWVKALKGVHYVYHLAAYQDQREDFSTFFTTNTVSTALLYETVVSRKLKVKKVILASSQFVYGDGIYTCTHSGKAFLPELRTLTQFKSKKFDILCAHGSPARYNSFREDQPTMPTNSYGLSKIALETLAMRLGKTYGIPTVALRYSIVQGERQSPRNLYSGALRIFITQALANKPLTVYEDGHQRRDFVNVHDVVAANILVLKNKKADFNVLNVGGGKAYTVREFAKLVKDVTKSDAPIKLSGFRRTDTRHAVSDITKIKKLGWKPRFTPEKSVRDYVAWYTKEFMKP